MISSARIADTLALAGHNVTVVESEFMIPSASIVTTKHAKKVVLGGFDSAALRKKLPRFFENLFAPDMSLYEALTNDKADIVAELLSFNCETMLQKHGSYWESLKSEQYDIFFAAQIDPCAPGLKHLMGARSFIWISSCPLIEYMASVLGLPASTGFVPAVISDYAYLTDQMTIYQRLRNIIEVYQSRRQQAEGEAKADLVYEKYYGPNFPKMIDIVQNVSLVFVMADEFLSFPRPILHNTIYVGGSGIHDTVHRLEEPFSSEMGKGRKGVVLFSMGTIMQTKVMPLAFKQHLMQALAATSDYHFIVKIDEDETEFQPLAEGVTNVKLVHWAPQPAILAHDRLKLFVTHGGYNSLLEVVYAAKPVITLPMFSDQWYNGYVARRNGFGRVFDKRLLLKSASEFRDLLQNTLADDSLREHALRVRKLIQTKPLTPTERILKYTKFVGENRDFPELHVSGRKLSTVIYYNIDIFVIGIVLTLGLIAFIASVALFILRSVVAPLLPSKNKQKVP